MSHDCEHVHFARKLTGFRATLSESEQQILDAMVLTVSRVPQLAEVEGYWLGNRLAQPFALMSAAAIGLVRPSSPGLECTWRGCIDAPSASEPSFPTGL